MELEIDWCFKSIDFSRGAVSPCFNVRQGERKDLVKIALHVEDLLIARENPTTIDWVKLEPTKWFEMKDLGYPKICPALQIQHKYKNRKFWLPKINMHQHTLQGQTKSSRLIVFPIVKSLVVSCVWWLTDVHILPLLLESSHSSAKIQHWITEIR